MRSAVLSLVACASTALAGTQGFNYGAVKIDGSIKVQADFQSEFSTAKGLTGTKNAFTSARLYTTIQAGTDKDPISAIPAAIAEGTGLLLGIWASAGQTIIDNEIAALQAAIKTYGTKFTSLVIGLSVGSEDLYRITPTGLANDPLSVGANPDVLVKYIGQVRAAVKGTALEGLKIGHVDTWTGWVNGSNSAVVDAVDWLGMNTFPYFQTTDPNGIENGKSLFQGAFDATAAVSKGKAVWVTETGWPVSGKKSGQAEANAVNAKTYYDAVGCPLFGGPNPVFYYTLVDANTDPTQPAFGVVGTTLSSTPLYDLSCDKANAAAASASSSSKAAASATKTSGSSSATGTSGSSGSNVDSAVSGTGSTTAATTSATTKPNAASAVVPASVGGFIGALFAVLALF